MNKGLKSYTKQLNLSVGSINTYTNLYSGDANFIFTLPILTTVGKAPISVGLLFNKQKENEIGMFGKGMKLNYEKKLKYVNSTTINITNVDGTVDVYTLDEAAGYYNNVETGLKIEHWSDYDEETSDTTDYFKLVDNKKNGLLFTTTTLNNEIKYPSVISPKNQENIYIEEDTTLLISNTNDDVVRFEKNLEGLVDTITWKKNNNEMLKAYLTYTNNYLTKVVVKNGEAVLSEYSLEYNSGLIILTDDSSKDVGRIEFNGYSVVKLTKEIKNSTYSKAITINQAGNRTTVSDNGKITTYVFDNDGMLRFLKDHNNKFISCTYDMDTKQLLSKSSVFQVNEEKNLYVASKIISESSTNMTVISETDSFYNSLVGTSLRKISGGMYSFSILEKFQINELVSLIVWVKQKGSNSGWITLAAEGSQSCTTLLNKQTPDNEYQPIVVGIKLNKTVENVSVEIFAENEIYVGKIEVVKKGFGVFNEYLDHRLIKTNTNGDISFIEYDKDGNIIEVASSNMILDYDTNDKGYYVKNIGEYCIKNEMTYDDQNRLIKSLTTNVDETVKFNNEVSYSADDLTEIHTDNLGHTSSITKDNYGNVIKSINALGHVVDFSYNDSFKLFKLSLKASASDIEEIQSTNITYDDYGRINIITTKNGMSYQIIRDDMLRTVTIKSGNIIIMQYEYNIDFTLKSMTYGDTLDKVSFTYNTNGDVSSMIFNDTTYYYIYNNREELISIIKEDEVMKTFSYDDEGKLIKVLNGDGSEIKYQYDKNNLNSSICKVDGVNRVNQYNNGNNTSGYDYFTAFKWATKLNKYYLASLFDSLALIKDNGCEIINGNVKNSSEVVDVSIKKSQLYPYIELSSENYLEYNITQTNLNKGSFGFWLKPSSIISGTIFKINEEQTPQLYHNKVELRISETNNIEIIVKGMGLSEVVLGVVPSNLEVDRWTFIGVSFNTQGSTKLTLFVDDKKYYFTHSTSVIVWNPTCIIGQCLECEVSGVICECGSMIEVVDVEGYYNYFKERVYGRKEEINSIKFTSMVSHLEPNNVQLYPLNNNLNYNDLDGDETILQAENVSSFNHKDYFKFNHELGRFVYVPHNHRLTRELYDPACVTIGMKIYVDKLTSENQYLFEVYQDELINIGLFIDSNGYLKIYNSSVTKNTNIQIPTRKWVFVGLSYDMVVSSTSEVDMDYMFNVVVDNQTFETVLTSQFEITEGKLVFGSRLNEYTNGFEKTMYSLNGEIADLCVGNYLSLTQLVNVKNSLNNTVTNVTGYDIFDMFQGSIIKNNGNDILIKNVNYKTQTNTAYKSSVIKEETISLNNQTITRTYTTDSLGRVTGITDSVFGNKNYVYDDRGFLINDTGVTATYDSNGNILAYGDKTFEYSPNSDRLIKVDEDTIEYDSTNGLYPVTYKGMSLIYQHNKLVQINKNNSIYPIRYEYNEQGLRTKKFTPSVDKEYYYNKDKLITEICDYYRLDFLYDENDMLFGFIYNNTDKYYYVRDILLNILGIVDNQGTLVVKYDCNAWGKPINGTNNNGIIIDTTLNNIGSINPFRYKGYYYDEETQLYWVSSRYYSPELCRWISPDEVEYLEPDNIHGLNLYCYCMNNPIMYADPSGHFAIPFITDIINNLEKCVVKLINLITGIDGMMYESMEEAVVNWGNKYYPKTTIDHKERGAIIKSIVIFGKKYYYVGRTRKGFESTCWNAFVLGFMNIFGKTEGFVHTHTAYPNSNGTWNPNDYGPSDTDLWLFNVPGINRQFIANEKGQIYEFLADGNKIFIQS